MGIVTSTSNNQPYAGVALVDLRTGKSVNGAWADYFKRSDLADPKAHALQKRLFESSHTRTGIANGNTHYYSVTAPVTKDLLFFARTFTVDAGPVTVEVLAGATWTDGNEVACVNAWRGQPGPGTKFYEGNTDVSGESVLVSEYIPDTGPKGGTILVSGGVFIVPKNGKGLLRVINGANSNTIRFSIVFAELTLPDFS